MRVAARRVDGVGAAVAALAALTVAAWAAVAQLDMMDTRPIAFLAAWTLMMTAMMAPSAAPLVLLYARPGRARLLLGYLAVWAAAGIPVYAIAKSVDLMDVPAGAVAIVLAAAGAYQFTPLKDVCLRACRNPLDFIALRWGRSAFRLGAEHGIYCVGCCWVLMAVLVGAAAMSLAGAALIAAVVFAEKVLPGGKRNARIAGVALLLAAALYLLV
jgi:predicted metal-binding membrane protein